MRENAGCRHRAPPAAGDLLPRRARSEPTALLSSPPQMQLPWLPPDPDTLNQAQIGYADNETSSSAVTLALPWHHQQRPMPLLFRAGVGGARETRDEPSAGERRAEMLV